MSATTHTVHLSRNTVRQLDVTYVHARTRVCFKEVPSTLESLGGMQPS